jgi:RHS repeat protein
MTDAQGNTGDGYDGNNRLVSLTNPFGERTTLLYDT